MKTAFVKTTKIGVRITGIVLTLLLITSAAPAQPSVVSQKDNTRPETTARSYAPAFIRSFIANRWNGYNDIQWTALAVNDTRKFIVEYSLNAIDYLTAGELPAGKENYSLRHQILDNRPILYRIRSEQFNGKSFYSQPIILDGAPVAPVTIYPTTVIGNTINVNASWPVERIVVVSSNGTQVLTKDVNGQTDYMAVVVPSLGKGMYWMSFYGQGWKSTEKFVVP